MVNVYIKERINDQETICAGGVTSNTTYLGSRIAAGNRAYNSARVSGVIIARSVLFRAWLRHARLVDFAYRFT